MRFIACCIDFAILGTVGIGLSWLSFMLLMLGREHLGLAIFIPGAIATLYFFFLKDARRPSFGKRTTNLMVVSLDTGDPANARDSAIRSLMLLVCLLIPAIGWLVEPIVTLLDDGGRRLGDRAAGTQVIERSSSAISRSS
jgi:uncharacterized RDD family membrane protein YckC